MKNNWKLQNGFSLIELLIVIVILGIVSTIGVMGFAAAQKRARDANRISDLKQYQVALESYANASGGLYPSLSWTYASTALCSALQTKLGSSLTCPQDSKYSTDPSIYVYGYHSNGAGDGSASATDYVLWSAIESPAGSSYPAYMVCSNGRSGPPTVPFMSVECPVQ
jgi:prepilin-type N-terminal cleavage/methylation domain-containing protein